MDDFSSIRPNTCDLKSAGDFAWIEAGSAHRRLNFDGLSQDDNNNNNSSVRHAFRSLPSSISRRHHQFNHFERHQTTLPESLPHRLHRLYSEKDE